MSRWAVIAVVLLYLATLAVELFSDVAFWGFLGLVAWLAYKLLLSYGFGY